MPVFFFKFRFCLFIFYLFIYFFLRFPAPISNHFEFRLFGGFYHQFVGELIGEYKNSGVFSPLFGDFQFWLLKDFHHQFFSTISITKFRWLFWADINFSRAHFCWKRSIFRRWNQSKAKSGERWHHREKVSSPHESNVNCLKSNDAIHFSVDD